MNVKTLFRTAFALGIASAAALLLAQKGTDAPGFYCDMSAMTKEDHVRHSHLVTTLAKLPHTLRELPNGYELRYVDARKVLPLASEWMALEIRCCPFLRITVAVSANKGPLIVRMTGAKGVKPFLMTELELLLKR